MPFIDKIKIRRGTAAQWAAANPVLDLGELGFATDTRILKTGDGATAWNLLPGVNTSGLLEGGGTPLAVGAIADNEVLGRVQGEVVGRTTTPTAAPTLLSGWSNAGQGFETAGYYKDPFGVVRLVGTITGGQDGRIAVLPAGFRPRATQRFPVATVAPAEIPPDEEEPPPPGQDPPSIITNLTATAMSTSRIDLTWSAATGADGYRVHRSTSTGFTPTGTVVGSGNLIAIVTTPGYSSQGLASGTGYVFKVVAFNATGTSTSNEAAATTHTVAPQWPPNAIHIFPSDVTAPGALQAIVNANPAGSIFVLHTGTYRRQQVVPKSGNIFIGETGAVMSGSEVLTGWTASGGKWYVTGQTMSGPVGSLGCIGGGELCKYPEDVYADGEFLFRVGSLAEVTTDTFFYDSATGRIWIGTNPALSVIERSDYSYRYAFNGSGATSPNVQLKNLIIRQYANSSANAAIQGKLNQPTPVGSPGWLVEDCRVEKNHAVGLSSHSNWIVRRVKMLSNGQLGAAGNGVDALYEDCELAYNNYRQYNRGGEGGGSKWTRTTRLTVRRCEAHHNWGPGLWTDINNLNTLYEDNYVHDQDDKGIFHEISYAAVIRNNTVKRSGNVGSASSRRAAIQINSSENVEVYGNLVEDCDSSIRAIEEERNDGSGNPVFVRNLYVHDNIIKSNKTGGVGISAEVTGGATVNPWIPAANNRFMNNTYYLDSTSATRFYWDAGARNWTYWKANVDTGGVLASSNWAP